LFIYNGIEIKIPCIEKEKLSSLVSKFCVKADRKRENFYFLLNGAVLDEDLDESQIPINHLGQKIILAYKNDWNEDNEEDEEKENDENSVKERPKEIICPKCKESSCIELKNFKISFIQCKNEHKISNISISEFNKCQGVNLSKIICSKCKERNKGDMTNHLFFFCLTCHQNICPMCKINHNIEHKVINYDSKYYLCPEHEETYSCYCKNCKKNMCYSCEEEHSGHSIEYLKNMKINKELFEQKLDKMRKNIDYIKAIIKENINKLNKFGENLEIYYEIYKENSENLKKNHKNYETLHNSIILFNNNDIEEASNFIFNEKDKDDENKILFNILKVYEKMEVNTKDKYIESDDENIILIFLF